METTNPFADLQTDNTEELPPPTYSHGTDPAIKTIMELVEIESIDTIVINILTLMRNVYNKNMTIDENLSVLLDNIQDLITNFSDFFYKQDVVNPTIYFYLFDYSRMGIPSEYLRSFDTESKINLMKFRERFITYYNHSYQSKININRYNNTLDVVFEVDLSSDKPSFNMMRSTISSVKNRHIVALLTHIPIDAHVLRHYKSFIVRSYQGDYFTYKSYGSVIFGCDVPFLPSLHVVFGDKELIKGMVQRNKKKELMKLIEDNDWCLWSNDKIHEAINTMYVLYQF